MQRLPRTSDCIPYLSEYTTIFMLINVQRLPRASDYMDYFSKNTTFFMLITAQGLPTRYDDPWLFWTNQIKSTSTEIGMYSYSQASTLDTNCVALMY